MWQRGTGLLRRIGQGVIGLWQWIAGPPIGKGLIELWRRMVGSPIGKGVISLWRRITGQKVSAPPIVEPEKPPTTPEKPPTTPEKPPEKGPTNRPGGNTPPPPPPPPPPSPPFPPHFFTRILFDHPNPKIKSLQRKTFEALFSEYNLSVEEYGSYVAYFPSRLLAYVEQQDAFSAFRKFLGDLGVTPEEIFKDRNKASFARDAIITLYEADINCWNTPLSTEPLYQCLKSYRDLNKLKKLLNKLEDFTSFSRQLQKLSETISFPLFQQFLEGVNVRLESWDSISREDFENWNYLLDEYKSASEVYHNYLDQIDRDCTRLEPVSLTLDQRTVIESLLQEVEQLKGQLNNGIIEIHEGLHQLEILSDEIHYFVDEVLHRTEDRKTSSKEDFHYTSDELSIEKELDLFGLIIEELSLESLKIAHRRYAKIHHPDIGGDTDTMQKYNNAYDILKKYLRKKAL